LLAIGLDLQLGVGLWVIKMWRALSVKTLLGYDNFPPFLNSYYHKWKLIFHDFKDAKVSIKYVGYISVLWRPQGNPWSLHIKSGSGQMHT
jgi:hypothetical protein